MRLRKLKENIWEEGEGQVDVEEWNCVEKTGKSVEGGGPEGVAARVA